MKNFNTIGRESDKRDILFNFKHFRLFVKDFFVIVYLLTNVFELIIRLKVLLLILISFCKMLGRRFTIFSLFFLQIREKNEKKGKTFFR